MANLTPNSGVTPYCAPDAFLLAYDARLVGELVRSDESIATPTDLLSDPVLAHFLAAASGDVEVACLAGGRYAASDLAALTGNGGAMLANLVADLTYGRLRRLRGLPTDDLAQFADAMATLGRLRDGEIIFPFVEAEDAGLVVEQRETAADVLLRNRVSDNSRRFFGVRNDAWTLGGGYGGRWSW